MARKLDKSIRNVIDSSSNILEARTNDIQDATDFSVSIMRSLGKFFMRFVRVSSNLFQKNYNKWLLNFVTFVLLYCYLIWTFLTTVLWAFTFWSSDIWFRDLYYHRVIVLVRDFSISQTTDYSNFVKLNDEFLSGPKLLDVLNSLSLTKLQKFNRLVVLMSQDGYISTDDISGFVENSEVKQFISDNSKIRENSLSIVDISKDELGIYRVIVKWKALIVPNWEKSATNIDYVWEFRVKYVWLFEWYVIQSYKYVQVCGDWVKENILWICGS